MKHSSPSRQTSHRRHRRVHVPVDGVFHGFDKNSTKLEEIDGLTQFPEVGSDVKEKFIKVAPQSEANNDSLESLSKGLKSIILIGTIGLLCLFVCLVGYARMNLGVHCISQVVFGGVGGLAYGDVVYFQFFNSNLKRLQNWVCTEDST